MAEKNLPRIVADTNVLVISLIGKSFRRLLEHLKEDKFIPVFSEKTLEELLYVIRRPKFKKYFTEEDIKEFVSLFSFPSQLVTPTEIIEDCRDPKDNIFLDCAVAEAVDYIVSGYPDLLLLNPYRNIPIITPKEFFKQIDKQIT